jgi:DNA-damage-inducible protein J
MKKSTIQVRIDPDIKEAANKVLKKIGLTPSQVIGLLYKAIVRGQGLPFDLHIPNEETVAALKRSKDPKNLIAFDSIDEIFEYLESDEDETQAGIRKRVSKRLSKDAKARKTTSQF